MTSKKRAKLVQCERGRIRNRERKRRRIRDRVQPQTATAAATADRELQDLTVELVRSADTGST